MRAVVQAHLGWMSLAVVTGLSVALAGPAAGQPAAEAPVQGESAKRAADGARKKTATIAHVRLAGSLPDGVGQGGILADVSPHLHRIVERLDKAAEDGRVKAVVLSIETPDLGRARADEIRAAIGRLRKAGKTVAAHLVGGAPMHYAVAGACDTISMPPASTLELTGVRTEMTFFRSMLDRLGVAAEILQVGEFKGAGEPLTRDSMSPQLRAQYESFVGDLYDQLIERTAADRGLPADRVRELVDIGVFTPEQARAAKLIDTIAYEDELLSAAVKRFEADSPRIARDYAERKIDQDFSGIGGLVKLVELLSGQKQSGPAGRGRRIAIVHLVGDIREGRSTDDLVMGGAAGAETVAKAIRDADADEQVAAIVLRIDSPGGSALASDLIWREAERAAKPVVASLSDIAASGGYYVAVAADRIVAAPGSLTGSIGVVGGKIAVGGALEKIGVHTDVVSRGRHAGWQSVQTPFTPGEREVVMGTMQEVYRLFTTKVAAGRKLEIGQVAALAEGRVFTGRMAKQAGLVDRLGTLDDAIDEARVLAGIAPGDEVDRVLLPEPRGLFDDLFGAATAAGNPVARLTAAAGGGTALRAAILARIAGLPQLEPLAADAGILAEVLSGRPQLLLPARIRIR